MGIIETSERPHLQLVAEAEPLTPALQASRWPIDLDRFPYRPGEMPETLFVALPDGAVDRARADGLPLALWARLVIEAQRAKARVVDLTGRTPAGVDEQVRTAVRARSSNVVLGLSPLARYASAVLGANASDHCPANQDVEVFIPSEMALSWREAAAARGETLEAWTRSSIPRSSPDAGAIEGHAAAAGESLAAWYYAASLA